MNSELLRRKDGGGATCKKSSWANHGQTRFVSQSGGKLAKLRSLLQSMMTRRKDRRRYSLEVSEESDSPFPEIDALTFLARSRGTIHKGTSARGGGGLKADIVWQVA